MSQQILPGPSVDPIARIVNANFTEVYANAAAAQASADSALSAGIPFRATASITSAAAATPVHVLAAASVPTGKKAYLTGMILNVNGATAWTDVTATIVKIQDTNGTPVVGVTVPKALLTGNAVVGLTSLTVTLGNAVARGTGFTAEKGLDIVADAVFAAGSDIYVTLIGYLA